MAKTIFGTTEKSNFILNMSDNALDKMVMIILCMPVLLVTAGGIPAEFSYVAQSIPSFLMSIATVAMMAGVVVLAMRKRFSGNNIFPVVFTVLSIVLAVVSMYFSFSSYTSFWGSNGRYEGIMAYIGYWGFFLIAGFLSIKGIVKLLDIMILTGVFQCIWSVMQIIPINTASSDRVTTNGITWGYYQHLNSIAEYDVYLPSGVSGSPIFFASLLSILFAFAAVGALAESVRKKRIFYCICLMIFAFFAVYTHTVAGFAGIAAVMVMTLAVAVFKRKKFPFIKNIVFLICGVAAAVVVMIMTDGGIVFYDGAIMWQDSFYRLGSTGYYWASSSEFDIMNVKEVFAYVWGQAIEIIKKYPLEGIGADNFIYTQFHSYSNIMNEINSIDRPYNIYLYTCVSGGIFSLLAYISALGYSVFKTGRKCKGECEWQFYAILIGICAYSVLGMFSAGSVTTSPFFWIILGIACGCKKEKA